MKKNEKVVGYVLLSSPSAVWDGVVYPTRASVTRRRQTWTARGVVLPIGKVTLVGKVKP